MSPLADTPPMARRRRDHGADDQHAAARGILCGLAIGLALWALAALLLGAILP